MKKLLTILIFAILILPLISATNDIAYITKSKVDSNIISIVIEKGYTIDTINIANINSVNISAYKAIIVSNEQYSATEAAKIPVNAKNAVILNTKNMNLWNWISDGVGSITPSQPKELPIVDSKSSIVSGVSNNFPAHIQDGFNVGIYRIYYLPTAKKAPGVNIIIADALSFKLKTMSYTTKSGAVIATTKPGSQLLNGKTSSARGVFFGIPNTALWSPATKLAFKNSLDYAVKGEDRDNDGFYGILDCNDTNANINPNKTEIAYDRIDQNCDSYDLADVDNDGYCNLNYAITNKALQCNKETGNTGTDCNDNDMLTNIGSTDLVKNCINDAPTLSSNIPNVFWNENANTTLDLSQYFRDPENSQLTYTYSGLGSSNIAITIAGSIARFSSTSNWNGTSNVIFTASDGTYNKNSNSVTLTVGSINQAPVLDYIENQSVNVGGLINVNPTATDPDSDTITYTYSQKLNSSGDWQTRPGDEGIYSILITANDGHSGTDSQIISVTVRDPNEPEVTLIYPNEGESINTSNINFRFSVNDNSPTLNCELFSNVGGNFRAITPQKTISMINGSATDSFSLPNILDGNYLWNIKCRDLTNSVFAISNRTFNVDAPNSPVLNSIGDRTINENETITINVNAVDSDSINAQIVYSISGLPTGATFENQIFSWTPTFSQSGNYNLVFTATDNTNLVDTEAITIIVKNVKQPPQFIDAARCINKSDNIILTIQNPDDGDDFEIGEIIPIKFKVKNNFDEDKDFEIETHLYDLDEDSSVKELNKDIDIDNKDSETLNAKIKVPKDIENKNFAVYIYVEDEDGYCASSYKEIEIKRKKDDLSISKFEISPLIQEAGKLIDFAIRIDNLGSRDQDNVYIKIENKELGLNWVSNEFDIEKYDEDDTVTKDFTFLIPNSIKEGNYNIKASVVYDDLITTETKQLEVVKQIKQPTYTPTTSSGDNIIVTKTSGKIYLINPSTASADNLILTYPATNVNLVPSSSSSRDYVHEEVIVKNYSINVKTFIDDPLVKVLLIIFDIVLLVGSLILFARAIIYNRR